jgi:hypothetical protein
MSRALLILVVSGLVAAPIACLADDIVTTKVIGTEFPGKYKHPASFTELDNGDL